MAWKKSAVINFIHQREFAHANLLVPKPLSSSFFSWLSPYHPGLSWKLFP